MNNCLSIFDCPKCGKVLSDEVIFGEDIDIERDEIHEYAKCNKCNTPVSPRTYKREDGGICVSFEQVDEERARWANGFYDDEVNSNNQSIH